MSIPNNINNPQPVGSANIWVKWNAQEEGVERLSLKAEIYDSFDQSVSCFGPGVLKFFDQKIVFSKNGECVAFIKFSEEVQYTTEIDQAKQKFCIKFIKNGKSSFASMTQDSLSTADKQLQKSLFKGDFYSHYDIKDNLGSNHFSQVSLVSHKTTNQQFVVKTTQKSILNGNLSEKKQLLHEVNMLRKLNHKNIIEGIEFFESANAYKIVQSYCQGGSLETRISENKTFTLAEVCFFIRNILEGLEYLHSLGFVHNDLTPKNILLKEKYSLHPIIAQARSIKENCNTNDDLIQCGALFYQLATGRPLGESKNERFDLNLQEFQSLPGQVRSAIESMINHVDKRLSAKQILQTNFYMLSLEDSMRNCVQQQQQQNRNKEATPSNKRSNFSKLSKQNSFSDSPSQKINNSYNNSILKSSFIRNPPKEFDSPKSSFIEKISDNIDSPRSHAGTSDFSNASKSPSFVSISQINNIKRSGFKKHSTEDFSFFNSSSSKTFTGLCKTILSEELPK